MSADEYDALSRAAGEVSLQRFVRKLIVRAVAEYANPEKSVLDLSELVPVDQDRVRDFAELLRTKADPPIIEVMSTVMDRAKTRKRRRSS